MSERTSPCSVPIAGCCHFAQALVVAAAPTALAGEGQRALCDSSEVSASL